MMKMKGYWPQTEYDFVFCEVKKIYSLSWLSVNGRKWAQVGSLESSVSVKNLLAVMRQRKGRGYADMPMAGVTAAFFELVILETKGTVHA